MDINQARQCSKCEEPKPLSRFRIVGDPSRGWRSHICKGCTYNGRMSQLAKDPQKLAARRAYDRAAAIKWKSKNQERYRIIHTNSDLKRKHGITLEEYNGLLAEQHGRCKICLTTHSNRRTTNRLAVDHDHNTGLIRGLLCESCNRAIGLLKDNPSLLRKAAEYLEGNS